MNRELKKRKKRFWVLCMAAVLLLYNILPMTAYAAEYKMKNTYVESYELSAGGSIVPGDVLYMQYGALDLKYSTIEYRDENGNTLMTDTLDTDAQTFDGETYYKGIVKTYSAAGGDASKEALFKEWKIPSIYTSGGYATEVRLQAVMYIQSNIHYNLNADETNAATNPTTYLEGVGVASLEPASKTGHNFEGWYSEPEFTTKVESILNTQTGTVKLYPKFSLATYNINYELDGGTNDTTNPTGYTYGTVVTLADASKTGYNFDGWYSDAAFATRVTEISATDMGNKTLYAKFTPNNYTITYELDGGSNATTNPTGYTYGTVVTFADASKTGYNFDGWYSDAAFTTRVTEISATDMGNKTLYAKFTSNSYTITYVLNGGTNDTTNPTGYTYGIGVTLADASKTGYTFDGWYSDAAFTTRVTSISAAATGNMTLYAKFTANASTPTPNPGVTPTPTPNPGVTPTPTPNPGVTPTPTPAPAATVTEAPSVTAAPMVKDDVPKTGDGMQGILLFGAMLLSGIGLVVVGCRKSFTDEKQG